MLTGKERSYLRAEGNGLDPVIHIGKEGITTGLVNQVEQALTDHELIKGRVLDNALEDTGEVARDLAGRCEAELVQVIGGVFLLFRRNPEEPIYHLP